jgi:PDZ domain-containing protein
MRDLPLSVGARPRDLKRVADQELSVPGPPGDLQWPPESGGAGPPTSRTIAGWVKWVVAAGVVLVIAAVAGTIIRVPYDTFAPGGTLNLESRVTVKDAKTYPGRGALLLLFVRERTHVNLWALLQAKLDSDIDIVKQESVTGGTSQRFADLQAVCDMTQSQNSARVAALRALGYKVPVMPGLDVIGLPPSYSYKTADGVAKSIKLPAYDVLRPCDEIVGADGQTLGQSADLSKIVKSHKPGTSIALRIARDGHEQTVKVPVVAVPGGRLVGVSLARRYQVPVQIQLDTSDISGPSAGLAMTLAIIDQLTPGDLTGAKNIAVTGTIDPNGNVGEIGALEQKAVAARAAGAKVFIVPACANDPGRAACEKDIAAAKKRVGGDVLVAPVSTLAQALKVLRDAGGSPVRASSSA